MSTQNTTLPPLPEPIAGLVKDIHNAIGELAGCTRYPDLTEAIDELAAIAAQAPHHADSKKLIALAYEAGKQGAEIEALEREYFGDAEKGTGIYHPDNRQAQQAQGVPAGHKLLEDGKTAIPADWAPLRLEWEPGYPEDVAFGPQRMMDRLKKWLDRHFATLVAARTRDWMAEFGFEIRHDDNGVWLLVDDCGNEREATLNERVLWDALTAAPVPAAAPQAEPQPEREPTRLETLHAWATSGEPPCNSFDKGYEAAREFVAMQLAGIGTKGGGAS